MASMSKVSNTLMHRVWNAGIAVAIVAGQIGLPVSAMAAVDSTCLQNANRERATTLQSSYEEYAREMRQVSDTRARDEDSALRNSNTNVQQILLDRATADYEEGKREADRRLQVKLRQGESSYQTRRASCDSNFTGFNGSNYSSSAYNSYYNDPYSNNSSYNNQYYNNSYYNNSYSSSYSNSYYDYSNEYPYDSQYSDSYYRSNRSNYSSSYSNKYNNNYQYDQSTYSYPYTSHPYSNGSYYNYGSYGYPSYGQYVCPQVVMTTLRAGCGYDCQLDSSGCRRCDVSCRAPVRRTCGCAQSFKPVCGQNDVTYINACFADCAGVGIRQTGLCH